MQQKHFLLDQSLHNLTGSRKVIDIVHKLGHCTSCNTVCEIETAHAECALEVAKRPNIFKPRPSIKETVFTFFWVDNFYVKVERMEGVVSKNNTHLMTFQENQNQATNRMTIKVPCRKSHKLFYKDMHIAMMLVDAKKEPEKIKVGNQTYCQEKLPLFNKLHFIWVYTRKRNYFDQMIQIFKGWALNLRSTCQTDMIKKTLETYLPPITTKVTEFLTIQKYITYLQSLAATVNMPYVNITLDVGIAINAYKTVWSYLDKFKNVIIHLGSFHFLKENFQVYR